MSLSTPSALPQQVMPSAGEGQFAPGGATVTIPASTLEGYQHRIIALDEEVDQLKRSLAEERANSERLKAAQQLELESLGAFLDTHDKSESSEIAAQLFNINNSAEDLAAQLACEWKIPTHKFSPDLGRLELAKKNLTGIFGEGFVSALQACNLRGETTTALLTYALQAVITHHTYVILRKRFRRGYASDPLGKNTLEAVATAIQTSEIQPVYGRWRSITHKSIRSTVSAEEESAELAAAAHAVAINLDLVGGLMTGSFKTQGAFHEFKKDIVSSTLDVLKQAVGLGTTVGEDVITTDYRLFAPQSGRDFSFDANRMNLPGGIAPTTKKDPVLFTMSLGMFTEGKPGRERLHIERRIFRKAVVMTQSVLDELLRQAPKSQKPNVKNAPTNRPSRAPKVDGKSSPKPSIAKQISHPIPSAKGHVETLKQTEGTSKSHARTEG